MISRLLFSLRARARRIRLGQLIPISQRITSLSVLEEAPEEEMEERVLRRLERVLEELMLRVWVLLALRRVDRSLIILRLV